MDGGGPLALVVAIAWLAVEANRRYRRDTPKCLREDAIQLLARADGIDARKHAELESAKKWRQFMAAEEDASE